MRAFLFPGQGSQAVGMGAALAEASRAARDVFGEVEGEAGGLLSEDDIAAAGEALSPGSTALAIVWENSWARRLIDAIVGSGGRLVAHDRLDAEAVNEILAEFAES